MDRIQSEFAKIYDANIEKIYRFVFLRVDSKETAQDLTSETFVKCWASFKTAPDNIKNPRAFLYKTAKNLVIDHYRKQGRNQTAIADFADIEIADPKADFGQQAILASDMETVRKALGSMNEDYQNAIIWRYLEDMPIKEVSHLLERSEEATRVLLHRAMKDLRTRLS
jgi:RNA polymerase sigma-70 factor, ECF subfamily